LEHHHQKKGLLIWGDNDPYYAHANLLLPKIAGCELIGNDMAAKVISYGEPTQRGKFDKNHLIFAGINNLYEGITICFPNKSGKLQTLATSTDGHPCILAMERSQEGGRVIVDTGFTKLYKDFWTTAGQPRYVVNASVYLVDVEGRFGS